MATVHVATANGVHTFGDEGTAEIELHGRPVTGLCRAGDGMWALVDPVELWRADDRSGWHHSATLDIPRPTCIASVHGELLVGTAEAHVYRVTADGVVDRIVAFDDVDGRADWFTPWGGPPDTRSIANWDDDVYVNVHVGGIPRTSDGGATWTPTIDIESDVHQVTTAPGRVLAACAGGLAVSENRGATWAMRIDGLEVRYARAVAVSGDQVLLSSSRGPRGGGARVSRAPIDGGPFIRCDAGDGDFGGNVDTAWLDALPEGGAAAFGTEDGRLFTSTDGGGTWTERASGLPSIRRVLVMPS